MLSIKKRKNGPAGKREGPEAYQSIALASIDLHRFASFAPGEESASALQVICNNASSIPKHDRSKFILNVIVSMRPSEVCLFASTAVDCRCYF